MDTYKKQQQHHEWESKRRRPVDGSRRTKMRKENETTGNDHNGSSGTNSICFSLQRRPQPDGEGGCRGRSPGPGFDPRIDDSVFYKTSIKNPNLPTRRSVNEKKVVNWQLACFMSNEYLTRGTLLGRPWPPQDSNSSISTDDHKTKSMSGSPDEKEKLYHTLTDFLRAGDVHLPGIVNPSQLAAWIGLN